MANPINVTLKEPFIYMESSRIEAGSSVLAVVSFVCLFFFLSRGGELSGIKLGFNSSKTQGSK